MLHVLSVKQPWAWLIANGFKDIENRVWRTNYRGPVLIHAGKSVDKGAYPWIESKAILETIEHLPVIDTLPKGGIVGYTEIIDCVANSQSKWFAGPWGFVIKNSRPLPFVQYPGQLKFFNIPFKLNEKGVLMADEMEITKREDTVVLPVPLSQDELIETMDQVSQKIKAVEDLEEELADIKKDYGKSIKKLDSEIKTLAKNYREKKKEEEIECIIEFNWSKGIKKYIRKSDDKVIDEKKITDADRQEKLDLEDHGKPFDNTKIENNQIENCKMDEGKEGTFLPDGSTSGDQDSTADAPGGQPFEVVDNIPGTDVEVQNGDKWVEIPFAGLKESQTFRLVKEGKLQEREGKTAFMAIGDPEQDENGFWKIQVV